MIQCTFSSVCILMRMTLWVRHLRAAMLIQPSPLRLYLYMDAKSFGNVAAWIHGSTETPMHWYTDYTDYTDTRMHGYLDAWIYVWCMMYDVCMMWGARLIQPSPLWLYIYNLQHVFGRMHWYMDDVRCMMCIYISLYIFKHIERYTCMHVLPLVQIAFFNCRQSVQKHTAAQESTEDVKKVKKKSYWDFRIQWCVS